MDHNSCKNLTQVLFILSCSSHLSHHIEDHFFVVWNPFLSSVLDDHELSFKVPHGADEILNIQTISSEHSETFTHGIFVSLEYLCEAQHIL